MVVKKALKMAESMNVPVLGLIENMRHLTCPHCNEKIELFGSDKGEEVAKLTGVPFLGGIPLDKHLAECCDLGKVEDYENDLFKKLLNIQPKTETGGLN